MCANWHHSTIRYSSTPRTALVLIALTAGTALGAVVSVGCREMRENPPNLGERQGETTAERQTGVREGKATGGIAKSLSDIEILDGVKTALLASDAVPDYRVTAKVDDGIVTLSGTVDNLRAKAEAAEAAEFVKGVRSVVNTIDVEADERRDAAIRRDVSSALLWDPTTENYEIKVTVDDGTVTLSGAVDSWVERRLAADVTRGVRSVKKVKNELLVDYDTPRADPDIEQDVEERLANDARIDPELVEVDVRDGRVILKGTVSSAAEATMAQRLAWVAGVKEVDAKRLDVRWWARDEMRRTNEPRPNADMIRSAVFDAFQHDPRVAAFEPKILVDAGTVTLLGNVDSVVAKRAAERDAKNTVGVWRVRNLLDVRPATEFDDKLLQQRVEQALSWNAYVGDDDLDVKADDGAVYLRGNVDTRLERNEAQRIAEAVYGVLDVRNHITVTDTYTQPPPDWELAENVKTQLFWNPYVEGGGVEVKVNDGVVVLEGVVQNWAAYKAAVDGARAAGARRVISDLRVARGPKVLAPPQPSKGT